MSDIEDSIWADWDRTLKPILGPHSEEAKNIIEKRREALIIWSTPGGRMLLLPPPSPLLLPLTKLQDVLKPGGFTPPPLDEVYRIEGTPINAGDSLEICVRPGEYLKGVLRWDERRYISYLFLRPAENLIPLLLSSSEPPIPSSLYCKVEEATYLRKGSRAYLLQVVFDLGRESTPLFTILLKSMGAAIEEVMGGGGEEVLYQFIRKELSQLLQKAVEIPKKQFERSDKSPHNPGGRLADRLLSLRSEKEVTPQDVGRWVGALSNLKSEVMKSLLELPLSEEVKNLILHLQRTYASSKALRKSVDVLKEFQGTPQYLLLTDLRLENLRVENGFFHYAHDPLTPILHTPYLLHSPPPAHLSPILNSLSRTALVSLKRETFHHLSKDQERVIALQRARFVISTIPRRPWELTDIDARSPLYHLKFSSAYGYTTESMLGYAERYLLAWLEEFYKEKGANLTRKVLLSSLYFFSILRGLAEIKGRLEEGHLPINYLLDTLLILIRNLNKYEAIYGVRG